MKFKTTKKNMKENYNLIIGTSYCSMQALLHFENEIAYSTRAEGWACDYYDIENVLISTGYSPMKSTVQNVNYDMINEYEVKAMKLEGGYKERKEATKKLLHEFITEVKKSN